VPIIPGYAQVVIGSGQTGPDIDLPEWDDENYDKGIAVSSSAVYVGTGDRSDFVVVDVRDDVPAADAVVLFEGKLRMSTLIASPPDDSPSTTLFLPGEADWRTFITVDTPERENIRRITVHVPELADPRLPDGL
jgi:hypothetical protein